MDAVRLPGRRAFPPLLALALAACSAPGGGGTPLGGGRLDRRTARALEAAGERPLGLLAVDPDPARLARAARETGLRPGAPAGGVIPLRGRAGGYWALLARDPEASLTGPGLLSPRLDVSGPLIRARAAEAGVGLPRGYDGSDVVVGIIDLGLDWSHPDFHNPDGSSRIVAIWNQLAAPAPPALAAPEPFGYGVECGSEIINEGGCPELDDGENLPGFAGHGTHVAGTAAGSGAVFRGIAPGALIVFVKSDLEEAGVVEAVQYVFGLAQRWGKAAVVNISLGEHVGGHDGRTPFEQALSSLVGPGRAIVAAAGNEGWAPPNPQCCIHAGVSLAGGASSAVRFFPATTGGTDGPSEVEAWCTDNGSEGVFVGSPATDGTTLAVATPVVGGGGVATEVLSVETGPLAQVTVDASPVTGAAPGDRRFLVDLAQGGGASTDVREHAWVLGFSNGGEGEVRCDAWTSTGLFGAASPPTMGLALFAGDNRETVGEPATARGVIAAGAFVSRLSWTDAQGSSTTLTSPPATVGNLCPFSSRGPTRRPDLTGAKPELSAPGMVILSARPLYVSVPPEELSSDGLHYREFGSSMASPHVAGAVALLFDRNPALSPDAVVEALRKGAVLDASTGGAPGDDWGGGKLDVANALREVPVGTVRRAPPVISNVRTEPDARGRVFVRWETDEPATSRLDLSGCGASGSRSLLSLTDEHALALPEIGGFARCSARVRSIDARGNKALSPPFPVGGGATAGGCSTGGGASPAAAILLLLFSARRRR